MILLALMFSNSLKEIHHPLFCVHCESLFQMRDVFVSSSTISQPKLFPILLTLPVFTRYCYYFLSGIFIYFLETSKKMVWGVLTDTGVQTPHPHTHHLK